jgi:NitT/TauT family transport system substrate-binding protein
MYKRIKKSFLLILILPVMTAPAWGDSYAQDKIIYRLKWLTNVSVVGALYADAHEIFKQAGLLVEIKSGGPERDAVRELELGYADFGEASADQVIRARAKGSPVVVIAQLFQVNPLQWIYRPQEIRIANVSDLKGKVIGVTFGGNDETILRALMAGAHIADSDARLFSVRYDYTPFYRRQVHMWPVYRNAQGPIISQHLEKAGEKTAYFNPADFGVNFVANSVVTGSKTLQEKPDLVKRFLKALLEGWRESLAPENQAKAVAVLQKFDPGTPRSIHEQQLDVTRALIRPTADVVIGSIDEAAWAQTEKIMLDQKLIQKPVDITSALKPIDFGSK